jgi:hypothetical protein
MSPRNLEFGSKEIGVLIHKPTPHLPKWRLGLPRQEAATTHSRHGN